MLLSSSEINVVPILDKSERVLTDLPRYNFHLVDKKPSSSHKKNMFLNIWCLLMKLLLHCEVLSRILTLRISRSPRGPNHHLNTRPKIIWLLLNVHLAFNLKQRHVFFSLKKKEKEKIKILYSVSCYYTENLRVVHNQVTRNQKSNQCRENTKKKKKRKKQTEEKDKMFKIWMEDSSTSERFVAISLEHTWKRKLLTQTLTFTAHLPSDWRGGKHALLLLAMHRNLKCVDWVSAGRMKRQQVLQMYGCNTPLVSRIKRKQPHRLERCSARLYQSLWCQDWFQ